MRPKKIDVYINIAKEIASLSTCDRAMVGCVLVKNGRIIASGYNGSLSGHKHCDDVGHMLVDGHCIRSVHAEQNALMVCAKNGIKVDGCVAVCTHSPCPICTKLLIQAGIHEIVYDQPYRIEENPFKSYTIFIPKEQYDT